MAEWIQLKLNKMTAFYNFIHILTDEIQRKFVKNVEGELVVGHIFILSLEKVIMHILVKKINLHVHSVVIKRSEYFKQRRLRSICKEIRIIRQLSGTQVATEKGHANCSPRSKYV